MVGGEKPIKILNRVRVSGRAAGEKGESQTFLISRYLSQKTKDHLQTQFQVD